MSNLHPKLQETLDWINEECAFEEAPYSVWARAGAVPSEWCTVFDSRYRITVELSLKEDKVYAKASMTALGLSGFVEMQELCMPNSHLQVQIEQLATIRLMLPEDNINDHFHKVIENEYKLRRQRRKARREVEKTRMMCNMNPHV